MQRCEVSFRRSIIRQERSDLASGVLAWRRMCLALSIPSSAVPEGRPRIARRFNAGKNRGMAQVPKGRLNGLRVACEDECHQRISRPFGTKISANSNPALKRRAIVMVSLRDKRNGV